MTFLKYNFLCFTVLFVSGILEITAQKDQVSLDPQLEMHSERMLIKIGMITKTKPAKLKFGSFYTDNRMGPGDIPIPSQEGDKEKKAAPIPLFSFDIMNSSDQTARVEASSVSDQDANSEKEAASNEISVYITTSIDPEELWVLLMTKNAGSPEYSIKNVFLTNGTEEITFKNISGELLGKSEVTAPRGIEAQINENSIAALQYYSGGSFSYKKFIWISDQSEPQLQLVMAAVFSAMMEIGDYFEDSRFTE